MKLMSLVVAASCAVIVASLSVFLSRRKLLQVTDLSVVQLPNAKGYFDSSSLDDSIDWNLAIEVDE